MLLVRLISHQRRTAFVNEAQKKLEERKCSRCPAADIDPPTRRSKLHRRELASPCCQVNVKKGEKLCIGREHPDKTQWCNGGPTSCQKSFSTRLRCSYKRSKRSSPIGSNLEVFLDGSKTYDWLILRCNQKTLPSPPSATCKSSFWLRLIQEV